MNAAAAPIPARRRAFWRPAEPAFWVFAVFLVAGAVTTVRTLGDLSGVSRSGWILAWVLLAIYAVPIAILVYRLDLYEREPIALAAAAFAWGALGATGLSIQAAGWNDALAAWFGADAAATWGPALVTPVIEELLKAAGLVLLVFIARDEFDDMMDGFVYGALAGLGFAVVEDVVYFMAVFGGTPSGVIEGFSLRVLASGVYGHVLYTALVGMAIGVLASTRPDAGTRGRRAAIAAGLVGVAVLGHIVWNLPGTNPPAGSAWAPVVFAIKGVPLLVFVGLAVAMAHRRERRWLARALASREVADVVTPAEARVLGDPKARAAAVRALRRRAGRGPATTLQRLQREQVNLAMMVSDRPEDTAAIATQRDRCASLRLALGAVPGARA